MTKARDLANAGTALTSVSATELGYLDGVTSAVQTQVDAKASSSTVSTHTGASTGVHGVTGAVVGTTDTQTLSAKTLTTPVVNVPQIKTPKEVMNISASSLSGTNGLWATVGTFFYYQGSSTSNATVNFIYDGTTNLNAVMAVGDSVSYSVLSTQGATPYYISTVQVDGTTITPKWSGGTAPSTGNASAIDAYSFTIIKTANATFTVLAAGPIKYA